MAGKPNDKKKCQVCLSFRYDVVRGFCADCQPQDSSQLRALLGIDKEGRKTWKPKANSASSKSTTSIPKTSHHLSKSSELSSSGSDGDALTPKSRVSRWKKFFRGIA